MSFTPDCSVFSHSSETCMLIALLWMWDIPTAAAWGVYTHLHTKIIWLLFLTKVTQCLITWWENKVLMVKVKIPFLMDRVCFAVGFLWPTGPQLTVSVLLLRLLLITFLHFVCFDLSESSCSASSSSHRATTTSSAFSAKRDSGSTSKICIHFVLQLAKTRTVPFFSLPIF